MHTLGRRLHGGKATLCQSDATRHPFVYHEAADD